MKRKGDELFLKHIRYRRNLRGLSADLLELLFESGLDAKGLTDEEVLSASMQTMAAGFETTSNALAWTLYLLSTHPNYLKKAREEFSLVAGNRPLRFEQLRGLKLNRAIIAEAMRLFPPLWMIDRVAKADDKIGDLVIRKGDTILGFIYGMQRAPEYWENPEAFWPERFLTGKLIHGEFAYLPFGTGPNSCVGTNYAMLQMFIVLSGIIMRYDFELCMPQKIRPQPRLTLRPRDGLRMNFTFANP
jgi:cytochrome P450